MVCKYLLTTPDIMKNGFKGAGITTDFLSCIIINETLIMIITNNYYYNSNNYTETIIQSHSLITWKWCNEII